MRLIITLFLFSCLINSVQASDFFKDKTLKIYSNSAVGSFPDLTARVFAKHLENNIPNISNVLVINKPGGNGVIGPNYLSDIAINDGTSIGYFSNILLFKYINNDSKLTLDPQLGYTTLFANIRSSVILVSSNKIKNINDLKDKKLILNFGLTNTPSAINIVERLSFDLFNIKINYISGYKSNNEILRSVEQNETDIVIHSANQYKNNFYDTWIKNNKLTPLWVSTFQKNIDIPSIDQVYLYTYKKYPEGIKWDSYKFVEGIQGQQLVILSSAPKESINILNKALDTIKNSESFKKDIALTLGNDNTFYFNQEADDYIKSIATTSEVLNFLKNSNF